MDRKLKWFLVEYDRHKRELRNLTEYLEPEQRYEAWSELRRLEKDQFPELQSSVETGLPLRMEYVLLIAESEEAIRVTHGNYFESIRDRSTRLASNCSNAEYSGAHREAETAA